MPARPGPFAVTRRSRNNGDIGAVNAQFHPQYPFRAEPFAARNGCRPYSRVFGGTGPSSSGAFATIAGFDSRWSACQQAVRNAGEIYNLAANMGGIGFIEHNKAVIMHDNVLINIHMLEALERAEIVDILSPPYAHARVARWYAVEGVPVPGSHNLYKASVL